MSPLPSNIAIKDIPHEHQFHPLTNNTPYLCDGCKTPGNGSRFTCTICQLDLHHFCAECPTTLTSSITTHPHPFSLVVHKPEHNQPKSCLSCHGPIEGLAYKCIDCNIFVHPLCALYELREVQDREVGSGSTAAAQSLPELFGVVVGKALVHYAKRWFNDRSNNGQDNEGS
ncbi:hypothetical protein E3N88_09328 [Mikania micrantha]|uniref:Phorbol-ester/DAG-type domain-containing protein n=1 Tax=Mikania micrantha TaxID=192012 RepID=A0A5N6PJF8_9ASTR|nr:hypothetical protein E3N88_09328 [Mikania micrantha]